MSEGLLNRYREQGIDLSKGKHPMFAPSIADDYQNTGLASLAMPAIIKAAKELGAKSLVLMGGTQATNKRAITFYEKFGFKHVCDFETKVLNYDMQMLLDT
jgi:GNAT superfamily N-acetyltransferase